MLFCLPPRSAIAAAVALAFATFMPSTVFAVGSEPPPEPTPKEKKGKKKKSSKHDTNQSKIEQERIYAAGYWAAKRGEYLQALDLLRSAPVQADTRVQTMIGFSLRMLGHVDEGMAYYHAALATNPKLTTTRQYLGEAYLQKGDRAGAVGQLAEIARLCGTACSDYRLLADAIERS
jgi:tetratricopeptide (TPR) repeat protein